MSCIYICRCIFLRAFYIYRSLAYCMLYTCCLIPNATGCMCLNRTRCIWYSKIFSRVCFCRCVCRCKGVCLAHRVTYNLVRRGGPAVCVHVFVWKHYTFLYEPKSLHLDTDWGIYPYSNMYVRFESVFVRVSCTSFASFDISHPAGQVGEDTPYKTK